MINMLIYRLHYLYHFSVTLFLCSVMPYIIPIIYNIYYIYLCILFSFIILGIYLLHGSLFTVTRGKLLSYNIHDKLSYRCHYIDGLCDRIDKLYICNHSLGDEYYELDMSMFCCFDNVMDCSYYDKEIISCDEVHKLLKCINRKLSVKRNFELYKSKCFDRSVMLCFSYVFYIIFLFIFSFLYFKYFV